MADSIEVLKVFIDERPVGRMVLTPERLCVFEYDPGFISTGFSLSPFYLPLRHGAFTARQEPFDGLFGIFNDSLPDGWGNLLIDRYLTSKGVPPQSLSVLDRLSIVGSMGMGAIQYKPEKHIRTSGDIKDLNILAMEIEKLLSEIDYTESIDILAKKGGSSGGARPKVLIHINEEPWIVKFPSSYDQADIGEIEYNYSVIAKKCGLKMQETTLLEGKYFGVKRFDRSGEQRIHVHTASGLLYASHRFPSLDYIDLIKATLALTKDMGEAYKMFRLMVFNVLTGNKDDHAKNFSFIYNYGKWKLAPAYDLTPNNGFNGNHSSTVSGKGNPSFDDIYEVVKQCGLKLKKAKDIFEEVYDNSSEIQKVDW